MKAKITITFEYELIPQFYMEDLTDQGMLDADIKYLNAYPKELIKWLDRSKPIFAGELISS